MPIFVLTHRPHEDDRREGTTFTFVTDGFDATTKRARAAAGDKDVMLHGGTAIQQGLRAGVLDELQLHVVPVLLGAGRRLWDNLGSSPITLEPVRMLAGNGVTHLKYRITGRTEP